MRTVPVTTQRSSRAKTARRRFCSRHRAAVLAIGGSIFSNLRQRLPQALPSYPGLEERRP